jgi:hypothetical protein
MIRLASTAVPLVAGLASSTGRRGPAMLSATAPSLTRRSSEPR